MSGQPRKPPLQPISASEPKLRNQGQRLPLKRLKDEEHRSEHSLLEHYLRLADIALGKRAT